MIIELITIGDEILLGNNLDTNTHWIARQLAAAGFRLTYHQTVGDNPDDILASFLTAHTRSDVILVTGGLGPTHDDITIEMLSRFYDDPLELRHNIKDGIRIRFEARGVQPSPGYEKMALLPCHAIALLNKIGSAPGIHYHHGSTDLFCMPGVPSEMKGIFADSILPYIESNRQEYYRSIVIRTVGTGESVLAEKIGSVERLKPVTLAFLPSIDNGVTLRLSCSGICREIVDSALKSAEDTVLRQICDYIYYVGEKLLEEVIVEQLRENGLRLAVAESCTGGMIANRLVAIPGCSDVFDRGYVTYSNRSKIEELGVPEEQLIKHGAVSAECATAMAEGARLRSGVDIGIAVTGIAGPSGGTAEKPMGLVYIAMATYHNTMAVKHSFSGDRDSIRRRATCAALTTLWRYFQ